MRIVVIGAGPGGMAAAVCAAKAGAEVILIDENPNPGGQIWRQGPEVKALPVSRKWFRKISKVSINKRFGTTVYFANSRELQLLTQVGTESLSYDHLVLSTGARELFLPFPGWTLPGIMGCGGAQALMKSGMPVHGKKFVVAGSGPLLFPVAASLKKHGAKIMGLAEQASVKNMLPFARQMLKQPTKIFHAMDYFYTLIPEMLKTGSWVCRANGTDELQSVTLTDGKKKWERECDILAIGYGLLPNTEIGSLLGCQIDMGGIAVDWDQKTSVDRVYAVGECTGIGGAEAAVLEGEVAALAILGNQSMLRNKQKKKMKWKKFRQALHQSFSLREEIKNLPEENTIICRCEDVSFGRLKGHLDQRSAKLYTRCGMGACQGKICGAACRELFGWDMNAPRFPLVPVEAGQSFNE